MTTDQQLTERRGLWAFAGYLLPAALMYAAATLLDRWSSSPGSGAWALLAFIGAPLLWACIFAGLVGGIHRQIQLGMPVGFRGFLREVRQHFWRLAAAEFLLVGAWIVVGILIHGVIGAAQPDAWHERANVYVAIPWNAIVLVWSVAIVAQRRVFASFGPALRFLAQPRMLLAALGWGFISRLDRVAVLFLGIPETLALHVGVGIVYSIARVAVTVFAVDLFLRTVAPLAVPEPRVSPSEPETSADAVSPRASTALTRTGFAFGLVSFVPLLHFVALILGLLAIRRSRRVTMMSGAAAVLGGFFTAFYALVLLGAFTTSSGVVGPGVRFLAEANPALQPQVALLEEGFYEQALQQIQSARRTEAGSHWTFDCASAIANAALYDTEAALRDYRVALSKYPTGGGCYYFYGLALMDTGELDEAAKQFKAAHARSPDLDAARTFLELIEGAYDPPVAVSVAMTLAALIILFTLHEYGHARAAWIAGDSTAKDQGRLTLNPIPHLSFVGSILLPGLLLFQQSSLVFGWARPVPVNEANFKEPRWDGVRVSIAGVAVNAVVAMLCFILLGSLMLVVRWIWPATQTLNLATPYSVLSIVGPPMAGWLSPALVFIKELMYTSIVLGVFNILPIPPLDGSHILASLLPQGWRGSFGKIGRFGFVLLLVLSATRVLDVILGVPIELVWAGLQIVFGAMGLG